MKLTEIQITDHPLRQQIIERGIPLQKLRMALGGVPSENSLSRALRGIDSMSPELERRIEKILTESEADAGGNSHE